METSSGTGATLLESMTERMGTRSECTKKVKRAEHFPMWRDGRTCMQRATLGKSGSEAASQLQGRIARAFSSNSLVNTMDMTAAIQYILTAAQSLSSQVYYKKRALSIERLILRHIDTQITFKNTYLEY